MASQFIQRSVNALTFDELQHACKVLKILYGDDKTYPFNDETTNHTKGTPWYKENVLAYFDTLDTNKYPIIVTAIESSFVAITFTIVYNK